MATALQLPPEQESEPALLQEVRLLVDYPSRWKEFAGNLRAALGPRQGERGFEEELGRAPREALAVSAALHVVMALAVVFLFPRVAINFPVVLDEAPREQTVIYYPAPSLPRMEDANAGKASVLTKARAPAKAPSLAEEAFHPVQTIRVSRGKIIRPAVVDAPGLKLPRVEGAPANILELAAAAAPAPQLAPQPVELARVNSKLGPSREAEAAAPTLARLHTVESALPNLSVQTATPSAAPKPVELARVKSKIGRSGASQETTSNAPQLQSGQTALPELALGRAPAVVVSVNSGDAVALPANGGPGSLAMSPEGRKQPNAGAGMNASVGKSGTGSTDAEGKGTDAGDSAGSPGPSPGEGNTSEVTGNNGVGKPGAPAIPGVVVRGGVVTLDSFGPKTPAANARPGNGSVERPRKPAPITIVATSRSGGGLNVYGVFKSQRVYTIYIDTKAGPVVLQFAARDAAIDAAGELTAPDPVAAELAPAQSRASVVISCLLDAEGFLKNLRVVRGGAGPEAARAVLEAVAGWRFHPALSRGKPVEVDALIGIRTGVH